MKRIKSPALDSTFTHDVDQEPIVLSKSLLDLLLKQDKPSELITLYTFYYYTAKWQKTNQPKATVSYAMKGLKMGRDVIRRTKQQLQQLGLIEDIIIKDKEGKITGHAIKLNFIWSNKTTRLRNHRVAHQEGNALSANNKYSSAKKINHSQFDKFWEIYPRKTDKGRTKTIWDKLCNKKSGERPEWKQIRRAIIGQKKSERWQNPNFIPYPSTWLNQSRWLDDPAEMKIPSNDKSTFTLNGSTPEKIIKQHIPQHYYKTFHRYFMDAEDLLQNTSTETSCQLAENIIQLYNWLEENQGGKRSNYQLTPGLVIDMYTRWLNEQDWIQDKTCTLYKPNGTIFRKFIKLHPEEVGLKNYIS